MKAAKLLLLHCFVFLSVNHVAAQKPYTFCCFQQAVYEGPSQIGVDWTDTSFRIDLDFIQKNITLHNNAGGKLRLLRNLPLEATQEGTAIVFAASDNKDDTCKVQFIAFSDPEFHMGTLILVYPTRQLAYRLHDCSKKRRPERAGGSKASESRD